MYSMSKLALPALALFASVDAAPLLSGLTGGKATAGASVSATADLKVFVDAFVKTSTGGKINSCESANLGLVSSLTASLKAQAFSKTTLTQCVASYSDVTDCTEYTAYLAVAYYAYISGWTGATLFAALETSRLDRWQSLIGGFCGNHGCPTGVCNDWTNQWNVFEYASVGISADVKAAAKLQLQLSGLLSTCDASAALVKIGADGKIIIGAAVQAVADVSADVKAKVDAVLNVKINTQVDADVKADLAVIAGACTTASTDLTADLKAKVSVLASTAASISADVKAQVDAGLTVDNGCSTTTVQGWSSVDIDIKAGLNVIAAVCANVDATVKAELKAKIHALATLAATAKASLSVDATAHASTNAGAIVQRGLFDVAEVAGGLMGEGKGKGALGVAEDKLGLGLMGEGKGKGFLGGVIA